MREQRGNIHITICKTGSLWEFAVRHREVSPVLCDNLERWDGVGDGREIQEGGDGCMRVADSCRCMAETSTILESKYLAIKIKKKFIGKLMLRYLLI